jgi:hypothetical protein
VQDNTLGNMYSDLNTGPSLKFRRRPFVVTSIEFSTQLSDNNDLELSPVRYFKWYIPHSLLQSMAECANVYVLR